MINPLSSFGIGPTPSHRRWSVAILLQVPLWRYPQNFLMSDSTQTTQSHHLLAPAHSDTESLCVLHWLLWLEELMSWCFQLYISMDNEVSIWYHGWTKKGVIYSLGHDCVSQFNILDQKGYNSMVLRLLCNNDAYYLFEKVRLWMRLWLLILDVYGFFWVLKPTQLVTL